MIYTPSQDPDAYQPLPYNFRGSLHPTPDGQYLIMDWIIDVFSKPTNGATGWPPGQWRRCVPPGTVRIGIVGYYPINAQAGIAMRYGKPPGVINIANWDEYPWERDSSATIDKLKEKDWLTCNYGGHNQAIWQYIDPPTTEAEWIYGYLIESAQAIQMVLWLDRVKYDEWSKIVQWDASGNPILSEAVPVPPDPDDSLKIELTVPDTCPKVVIRYGAGRAAWLNKDKDGVMTVRFQK